MMPLGGRPRPPPRGEGAATDCILGSKELLFRRCAVRVPLDLCASGTLTRSRSVHSVISREKPSKRTKEVWAESWDKAAVEHPVGEAGVEHPAVKAGVEPTVEAGV